MRISLVDREREVEELLELVARKVNEGPFPMNMHTVLRSLRRAIIVRALTRSSSKTAAARDLGITVRTVHRFLAGRGRPDSAP